MLVPGNHEFYNYADILSEGDSWCRMIKPNVGYYQNQVIRINDIDFIKFFCSKDWKEKYNIQQDVYMNIEIIGKLQINEYEGNTKKQILIEEMEIQQEENNFNFDDLFS